MALSGAGGEFCPEAGRRFKPRGKVRGATVKVLKRDDLEVVRHVAVT